MFACNVKNIPKSGRNDATNIITSPELSVITSIALDHTSILGNTIEAITLQKCGIIKNNCPTVIGPYVPLEIVEKITDEKNSKLTVVSFYDGYLSQSQLQSSFITYDEQNQMISHECLKVMADNNLELSMRLDLLNVNADELQKAMEKRPLCRMQEIKSDSSIICILDGAHNLNGMFEFFKAIRYRYPVEKYQFRVVFGMCRDKNIQQCLSIIMQYANAIHFVSIGNRRSLSVEELYACYERLSASDIMTKDLQVILEHDIHCSILNALDECQKNKSEKEEILLVCGSLYIMSTAREQLGYKGPKDTVDYTQIEFLRMT